MTIPRQILFVGDGPFRKSLQQIFVDCYGVGCAHVQSQCRPTEWEAGSILHVVFAARAEDSVGDVRAIHDLIWARQWATGASVAIILPNARSRDALAALDAFGNKYSQMTFQQLVEQDHHLLITRAQATISKLASWFAQAGIMTCDGWHSVKTRCSKLENLRMFLDHHADLAKNMAQGDVTKVRELVQSIDWHKVGGSEAHSFARRVEAELQKNQFSSRFVIELRTHLQL